MKIRIGNDLRFRVQLDLNGKYANIQSVKAYFINTTLKEKWEEEYKKKNRFIGRFPIEPFVDEFEPCAYNINSCGRPGYHAVVFNQYKGFGLHPHWKEALPIKSAKFFKYYADVDRTEDPTIMIVNFPAEAQAFTGTYELVITAEVYDSGYKHNTRTVTANYKDVVELVKNSEDEDTPTNIVFVPDEYTPIGEDRYVVDGNYRNNHITLERNDGVEVDVDISNVSAWYEGN